MSHAQHFALRTLHAHHLALARRVKRIMLIQHYLRYRTGEHPRVKTLDGLFFLRFEYNRIHYLNM